MKNRWSINSRLAVIETVGYFYSDNFAIDSFVYFLLKEPVYWKAAVLSSISAAFLQAIVEVKSSAVVSELPADKFIPLPAPEKFASVDFRKPSVDLQSLSARFKTHDPTFGNKGTKVPQGGLL